jgi:CPA2 family monovalent cation:H+ antiporter-2
MEHALTAILVLFGAAWLAAWLMRTLGAPAILGFLIAGIIIGPSVLNLIGRHEVHFFAELGLVLLLFVVGLELSPGPLLRMGGRLLIAAALQMAATTAVAAGLLYGLGLLGPVPAFIVGAAVALSSTAVMINYFADRGESDSPASAVATVIALFQDCAVILLLIALPLFSHRGGQEPGGALRAAGFALGALVVISIAARAILPVIVRLFGRRAGSRELMTLFAIVMACAGAWLASLANWSWGLGSFVAGLLLSQTDLRHQIRAEITPFRHAFNALFFISIGMLVELSLFREHAGLLAVAIVGVIVLKTLIAGGAILLSGWPARLAITSALALATISEFAYILGQAARELGLLPPQALATLIACLVGSMVLGALLLPFTPRLAAAADRRLDRLRFRKPPPAGLPQEGLLDNHVIIVGYGVNGRNLARVLRATRIPYTVVEMNPSNVVQARSDGAPAIVGDATRASILLQAGLQRARALVVSIADQEPTRRIVAQARAARPDLYIVARTRYLSELDALYRLGARQVIPEEFETSIEIFAHVLKEFGIPDNVIDQQIMLVRAGRYRMLRGLPTDPARRAEWLQILEAAVTQVFLLLAGSPAVGRTIREFDLRARTGVTIVALTRGGKAIPAPSPELRLQTADVLVLVGTHKQLDHARQLLETPTTDEEAGPSEATS